jgi:hypothetical protein
VAGEGQRPFGIERLDVAVAVALVAETATPTQARDVLELVAVFDRVSVELRDLAAPAEEMRA